MKMHIKVQPIVKEGMALWRRYAHIMFFVFLIAICILLIFEWYALAFAPRDRMEELKAEIQSAQEETLSVQAIEKVSTELKARYSGVRDMTSRKDIFYPEE